MPLLGARQARPGPLEGLDNTINVRKRQAYGFRDLDYSRLRLDFIQEPTLA